MPRCCLKIEKVSMKKVIVAALAVLWSGVSIVSAQVVSSFDDIQFWVGTGSNRSALVIDFHDGGIGTSNQESFVWGFRWDTPDTTGEDLIAAIASADPNLTVTTPDFVQLINYLTQTNAYEGEADYGSASLSWGYYLAGGEAANYDPDTFEDLGFFPIEGGGENFPTSWTISPSGSGSRLLADGSWDALSFGTYDSVTFEHQVPPSAVPEPGSVLLIMLGFGSLMLLRRRSSLA